MMSFQKVLRLTHEKLKKYGNMEDNLRTSILLHNTLEHLISSRDSFPVREQKIKIKLPLSESNDNVKIDIKADNKEKDLPNFALIFGKPMSLSLKTKSSEEEKEGGEKKDEPLQSEENPHQILGDVLIETSEMEMETESRSLKRKDSCSSEEELEQGEEKVKRQKFEYDAVLCVH